MYNNILVELWLDSPLKDRIVIGIHNLECAGGIREARFRDLRNRRYDGIHMYGPSGKKAYTISVLDILNTEDISDSSSSQSCTGQEYYSRRTQFHYQKQKHNKQSQKSNTKRTKLESNNDRDVRAKKYNKVQSGNNQRYSVPTSNMFDHLNC